MKLNRSSALSAAALLLLATFFGCSKQQDPAAPQAPQAPKAAKAVVQPPPVQKQLSTAVNPGSQLDFRRRTDPFRAYAPVEIAPPVAVRQQPSVHVSSDLLPIQTYEVSKFKVVGIIAGLNENRALLIDPAGKGYVVQQGMSVGNNDGRITKITASSVEVVERFREDSGRFKKRRVVLTLSKKR